MRELRMLGSVRGVLSNGYPYRDPSIRSIRSAQETSTTCLTSSECGPLAQAEPQRQATKPIQHAIGDPRRGRPPRRSDAPLPRAPHGKSIGIGAGATDVGEQLPPVTRQTP